MKSTLSVLAVLLLAIAVVNVSARCKAAQAGNLCKMLQEGGGHTHCQQIESFSNEQLEYYEISRNCFEDKICTSIQEMVLSGVTNCIVECKKDNCKGGMTFAKKLEALAEVKATGVTLPDKLYMKTTTETMTHEYYAVIRNDKVYYKRYMKDNQEFNSGWLLLMGTGLPVPPDTPRNTGDRIEWLIKWGHGSFRKPTKITTISADGDNLVLVADTSLVYYMKWTDFYWQGKWGFNSPAILMDMSAGYLTLEPDSYRSIAISHRGPYNRFYVDHFGKHVQTIGVTSFYKLNKEGTRIDFADPWLTPDWKQQICPPFRGTIKMKSMDASASYLFVLLENGQMATIFGDFDSFGNNPIFRFSNYYTYDAEFKPVNEMNPLINEPTNEKRLLPCPDWAIEDPIAADGTVVLTSDITILQGLGMDRELRRKGSLNAEPGYFTKKLGEKTWKFVKAPVGEIVAFNKVDTEPLKTSMNFKSTSISFFAGRHITSVEVKDFHNVCSPAVLIFTLKNGQIATGKLHTVAREVKSDTVQEYLGTLEMPADWDSNEAYADLAKVFSDRWYDMPVVLKLNKDTYKLKIGTSIFKKHFELEQQK